MAAKTPSDLGYRMPAEWQPHVATWLSWPRPDGISFPDRYPEALPTLGEMVRTLAPHERVEINVRDKEVEAVAARLSVIPETSSTTAFPRTNPGAATMARFS